MRKPIALAAVLLVAACASQRNNANGNVPEPDVTIEQTSSMPTAAQNVSGGIPISLRITVTNNAAIPITLQRTQLTSMGEGGWNINDASHNFGKMIAPGGTESMEFWVSAVTGLSIVGNNGPVQLRVTSSFDSSKGSFTKTIVQAVGGVIR